MSLKLPTELLATWNGNAPSGYSDTPWPVPGIRYKLAVEKHKKDADAVKVQIISRADGSANSINWAATPLHYDAQRSMSVDWVDIRLADDVGVPKGDWV